MRNITIVSCFGVLVWLASDGSIFAQSFDTQIKQLIESHRGTVAVAIKLLPSGESFTYRESDPQPTASLIKFPVMVTAYRLVEQGKISLEKKITLHESDKVQGSGILKTHFSEGTVMSLRDTIRLMMAYSDNTATNLVLDAIGLATTNEMMAELGLANTRIHAKVFRRETSLDPDRSERFGLGSTTAGEMIRLCELLESGKLANPENTQAMLDHMRACDDRLKVPRYLPAGTKLAHKTGSVDKVRCDSGILECGQGKVVYSILTENNMDQSWGEENKADLLCAEIGKVIFQHFQSRKKKPSVSASQAIEIGASGPIVHLLQRTLNARSTPNPKLTIDGEFGPSTQAAISAFQQQSGLEATGKLSPQTWKKLGPLLPVETVTTASQPTTNPPLATVAKAPLDPIDGPPFVTCSAWAITDAKTGEVLFEHEGSSLRDPASTTKIMTALLVIEHAAAHPESLNEIVTFSKRADATVGSTSDLYAGEKVSVQELLFGLMLPSGNDASVAFAEHFGDRLKVKPVDAGGYASFIAAMNRKAVELKLLETHYENSHGMTHIEHKCSARDLAALARHAWQQPLFRDLVSTRVHDTVVESEAGYSRLVQWNNTNRLLEIEGYDGVKTGTTDMAGACLVSSSHRGDRHLITVVLGSKSSEARYSETRNLFRWAWKKLGAE